MAIFTRYKTTFQTELSQKTSSTYTISIKDATLLSSLDYDFCTDERGFQLNFPTEDDEFQDVMKASSCTLGFMVSNATDEAFIEDLAVDQEGNYFIEIEKNSIPFWRGVVAQDESKQENRAYPYIFEITAIDGISELKTNKTPIKLTGPDIGILPLDDYHTALQTLVFALNQTRTSLLYDANEPFLVTAAKWFEISMPSDVDPLANMAYAAQGLEWNYNDNGDKVYESHYDIIEGLLSRLELRLIQDLGLFNVLQVNELRYLHIDLFTYAKNYQTTNVNPQTAPLGVISTNVPTQLKTTLDNTLPITQGVNFNHETADIFTFIGAVKDVKIGYDFEISNAGKVIQRELNIAPSLFDTGIDIISGTGYYLDLDGSTEMTYNSIIDPVFSSVYATAIMDVIVKVGNEYWDGVAHEWTTTLKTAFSITQHVVVKIGPVANLQTSSFPFQFHQEIPNTSGSLELQTDFRLIFPTWSATSTIDSTSTTLDVSYQTLEKDPIIVGYTATNNHITTSSLEIDLGETLIGDKLNNILYNKWAVFNGTSFINSSEWQIEQLGTQYKINELLVKEVMLLREEPSYKWEFNLLGDYTPFKTLVWDERVFLFNGGTFTASSESWNMVALEMKVQAVFSIGLGTDPKLGDNRFRSNKREIFENQIQGSKGFASFESIELAVSEEFISGTKNTLNITPTLSGVIKDGDVLSITNDFGKTEFITVDGNQEGGVINFLETTFLYEYPAGVQLNTSSAQVKNRLETGFIKKAGDTFQGNLIAEGDNIGIRFDRTDGTIAGGIFSDDPANFGMVLGGFDADLNLTNQAILGSNIYLGEEGQYIANNSALPHGYLKLGGFPVTAPSGELYYPLTFQQIEQELYSQTFTDANSHDLSSGLAVEIIPEANFLNNYNDPSDFEYTFRLEEAGTAGKSTQIEFWVEIDLVESPRQTTTVGADTIVTVSGGNQLTSAVLTGQTFSMWARALDIGQNRATFIRGNDSPTTFKFRQLGFGAQVLDINLNGGSTTTLGVYSETVILLENEATYTLPLLNSIDNKTVMFNLVNVSGGEASVKTSGTDYIYGNLAEDIITLSDGDNMKLYLTDNFYKEV